MPFLHFINAVSNSSLELKFSTKTTKFLGVAMYFQLLVGAASPRHSQSLSPSWEQNYVKDDETNEVLSLIRNSPASDRTAVDKGAMKPLSRVSHPRPPPPRSCVPLAETRF